MSDAGTGICAAAAASSDPCEGCGATWCCVPAVTCLVNDAVRNCLVTCRQDRRHGRDVRGAERVRSGARGRLPRSGHLRRRALRGRVPEAGAMSRAAHFLLVAVACLGCDTAGPCADDPNGSCYNAPISLNAQALMGDAGLCTAGAGDDTSRRLPRRRTTAARRALRWRTAPPSTARRLPARGSREPARPRRDPLRAGAFARRRHRLRGWRAGFGSSPPARTGRGSPPAVLAPPSLPRRSRWTREPVPPTRGMRATTTRGARDEARGPRVAARVPRMRGGPPAERVGGPAPALPPRRGLRDADGAPRFRRRAARRRYALSPALFALGDLARLATRPVVLWAARWIDELPPRGRGPSC